MFIRLSLIIGIIGLCFSLCQPAHAEGSLRERIKERIAEKRGQNSNRLYEANSNITQSGEYNFSIQHGGMARKYILYVPPSYNQNIPSPVVFAFHGGGGSMEYMANERYGLKSKADEAGFIVVFPNGYSAFKSGKFATWNAGDCCAGARDKNIDDVGFIKAVIQKVTQQVNIDKNRIFATGMSNGGMISYRMACELADTFKAIASVAGTDGTLTCNPQRPISIMHIHAKDDTHVLFNGGAGKDAFKDPSKVSEFKSVPDTMLKWVALNGCEPQPQRVKSVNGAYCDLYNNCRDGVQVKLCVTETGGHSWPGGEKRRAKNPPSNVISANDEIWAFFESK